MKKVVMKTLKYLGLMTLALIILSASYMYYLSVQRDTLNWVEHIQVSKNVNIPIEMMTSQRKYYGGHAFGWGGGDNKGYIKFKYKGINYYNNVPYIPIVIKLYKDSFYVIYFDRETDFSKITFRYFKSQVDGTFLEIEAHEFPKHLAIQNRWFNKHVSSKNKVENLIGLDPQKMRGTMTAKIWYMIEGKQSVFNSSPEVPIEFIKKYKEKYITNREKKEKDSYE